MSRPVDPTYVVPVWAPNLNYPVTADPWSATPTKTTHPGAASVGITPKTGVAAQVFNKVINDAYVAIGAGKTADQGILDHVGQLQALNFTLSVAVTTFVDAVFNAPFNQWFAIEGTTNCRASVMNGWVWGANLITGADTLHNIQVDTAGNMVVATSANAGVCHEFNISNSLFTRRTSFFGTASLLGMNGKVQIAYDVTNSLWCNAAADNAGNGVFVATSADRVTWTARGILPNTATGGSGVLSTNGVQMVGGGGPVLVALGRRGAAAASAVWTSANGGVSWTQRSDIAHGFATGTVEQLIWNAALAKFFYLVGDSTSHKLYSSPDGVTWTLVHSVATRAFGKLSSVGRILVANTATASNLVFSVDGGATWRFTGFGSVAGNIKIVTSGEQLLLLNSSQVFPGLIAGYGHGAAY